MTPQELARKAANVIRAFPATSRGVVSSWSLCMLDALMQADEFTNSAAALAVVDEIGRKAPKHPHRWSYHPERVRAEVVRGFERVVSTLEQRQ